MEGIQAEMERRCVAFECQLQSACSECTAAVEEHVTASLSSLKKRVDSMQACSLGRTHASFGNDMVV
jgi:positive regulator of sigma E activity